MIRSYRFLFLVLLVFILGGWAGFLWEMSSITDTIRVVKNSPKEKRPQQAKTWYHNIHLPDRKLQKQCTPRHNIMFMKTHKTASTGVQNIIFRYAVKENLEIALSATKDIRFHYGHPFNREDVRQYRLGKEINVICHHMVFNYDEVSKVMPPGSIYFTIVRDTSSLFESLFDYMHYDCGPFRRINKKQPNALEHWLNHTNTYFRGRGDGQFWWFAKNGMFFDFGYDNLNEDETYIQNAIAKIDKQFHLVMVSDYFDESLILLKDLLCWDFKDILSLKKNARSQSATTITERLKKKIQDWNKADFMIFDHFNKTLWKKIEEYGFERMKRDVEILNAMNDQFKSECIDGGAVSNKLIKDVKNKVYNPPGVDMKGYNLKESVKNNLTCVNLVKEEIQFTRELMKKYSPLPEPKPIP